MDRSGSVSVAIAWPFRLDDTGKVISTENYNKIYLDRALTLLSTNLRQRPILQLYGTDIGKYMFESDNNLEAAISATVSSAIGTWLPDVSVQKVTVGLPGENGTADVEILLRLPNGNVSSISLTTATFGYDGTITR